MVAFVQHSDTLLALLAVLHVDRVRFWGRQLTVVDALLADASDKVAHQFMGELPLLKRALKRALRLVCIEDAPKAGCLRQAPRFLLPAQRPSNSCAPTATS